MVRKTHTPEQIIKMMWSQLLNLLQVELSQVDKGGKGKNVGYLVQPKVQRRLGMAMNFPLSYQ